MYTFDTPVSKRFVPQLMNKSAEKFQRGVAALEEFKALDAEEQVRADSLPFHTRSCQVKKKSYIIDVPG